MKHRLSFCLLCLLAGLAPDTVQAVNLNTDPALILWLKLDETTGTSVTDSSASGLTATLTGGGSWITPGRLGGAVELAGDDDRIIVTHDDVLSANEITVACWIKPAAWSGNGTAVISKQSGSSPWPQFDFRRDFFAGNQIEAAIDVSNTNFEALSPASVTANTDWQHVAFTYDGDKLIVYHNGEDGAPTSCSGDLIGTMTDLWIGGNPSHGGRHFDGQIDDVRVYSRDLSQTEIQRLYNMRLQPVRTITTARRRG